jgi:hypothetical protein
MGVAATVTAAMPIGAAGLGAIPTYHSLERVLAAYASLFCFLLFAYIFYVRHTLARALFSQSRPSVISEVVPLALVILAIASGVSYLAILRQSVDGARDVLVARGVNAVSMADVLKQTDYIDAPHAFVLIALYLGLFVFAEAAFVLMAVREYLQDELTLSDAGLFERREADSEAGQRPRDAPSDMSLQ